MLSEDSPSGEVPAPVVAQLLHLTGEADADLATPWSGRPKSQTTTSFAQLYSDVVWKARRQLFKQEPLPQRGALRFVLRHMTIARTVREAMAELADFTNCVWPSMAHVRIEEKLDGRAALILRTPGPSSIELMLHELRGLSLIASALNWATGGQLTDIRLFLTGEPEIDLVALRFLCPYPVSFGSALSGFSVPQRCLEFALVRSSADVEQFLNSLSAITVYGCAGDNDVCGLVSSLVRRELLTNARQLTLEDASTLLRRSCSTLRRQIEREGSSFRQIRDSIVVDLARAWLAAPGSSPTLVSDMLGFSDVTCFRRFFRRCAGMSVGAFCKECFDGASKVASTSSPSAIMGQRRGVRPGSASMTESI